MLRAYLAKIEGDDMLVCGSLDNVVAVRVGNVPDQGRARSERTGYGVVVRKRDMLRPQRNPQAWIAAVAKQLREWERQ
jgi:hypothetical protein